MKILELLPEWFRMWFKVYVLPLLQIEARQILLFALRGVADTLLFLGLPLLVGVGSVSVWNNRFTLMPSVQQQVDRWAGISYLVAYQEDVPPEVPLVLWYKEAGLREENPGNCEGIMGFYSAVRSGELPCFPPGPISPAEVAYQLQLGARTFKSYCPDVSFDTHDPTLLKRCYLYYNAGPGSRADPDTSAYVMNNYDAAHQNMIHTDISGRSIRLQATGAWPVHLSIQAQMSQPETMNGGPFIFQAPVRLAQEGVDRLWVRSKRLGESAVEASAEPAPERLAFTPCREPREATCLVPPRERQEGGAFPHRSPMEAQAIVSDEIACSLLPGVDLATETRSVIVAPMAGALTRYATVQGFLAVRIENEEWTLWLTGLRSYLGEPGEVKAGAPVGVIGGQGSQTPAVHYAVYDKMEAGYVDPLYYIPAGECQVLD